MAIEGADGITMNDPLSPSTSPSNGADGNAVPKICILNYGMGNLGSVQNALRFLGIEAQITSDADTIKTADAYILPGVGAFGEAMHNLNKLGIIKTLETEILKKAKPLFGICLGLQLLAEDSQEKGFNKGLGWFEGHVVPIEGDALNRVPHVGWNGIDHSGDPAFLKIEQQGSFYFDHSFHLECDPKLVTATCDHGQKMVAAIRRRNIFATQFHPEKSQRNGLKLLRNFVLYCFGNM